MKKLSIVIPFYNEGTNLNRIYSELRAVRLGALSRFKIEVLLMDNHSTDNSFAIATDIAQSDPEVRVIRLSRNFGYQANILTGLHMSTGDAVVQLDADGEDDPALIPGFVDHWEKGYQVVYGIRRSRRESWTISLQRKLFYRLLSSISKIDIPVDAGDFRLMDRQVVDHLKTFKEANPYLRGLITYVGFSQLGIPYDRRKRFSGISKFNWWSYVQLAWDGITSFSGKPLVLSTWLGFLLSGISFMGALFYLAYHFLVGPRTYGFTTIVLLQLFLAGIQLLCIGVIGTYLSRIFDEVKGRPRSIVETTVPVSEGQRPLLQPQLDRVP